MRKVDVRVGEVGADECEPADLVSRISGQLDETCRERVVSSRQKEWSTFVKGLPPRLARPIRTLRVDSAAHGVRLDGPARMGVRHVVGVHECLLRP